MGVNLRVNTKNNGTQSFYLDIYNEGKRYKEYLGISIQPPRTPQEREQNKEKRLLAESIRAKREMELLSTDYEYSPKRNIDFLEYFYESVEDYTNKDYRLMRLSYKWFERFLEKKKIKNLKARQLDEKLCKGYLKYLQQNLNGETPYNYFTKFKKVVKEAVKEGYIYKNPTDGIKVTRDEGLKKEILSFEEIQLLASTPVSNNDVKRAFLFSLYTGLRWVDVSQLTYSNIDFNQNILRYTQSKTKHSSKNASNVVFLSPLLLKLIGEPKEPEVRIFDLPTANGSNKVLQSWVDKAGIPKRITWHCARHSFAVNQLSELKTDVKTVADLLGHSGLKYVERYTRVIDEKKAIAIHNQPDLEL